MVSTRYAPGTIASPDSSNNTLFKRKNSSSTVSAWIPYTIESASEPVSLYVRLYVGNLADQYQKNLECAQFNMFPECFWLPVQVDEEV